MTDLVSALLGQLPVASGGKIGSSVTPSDVTNLLGSQPAVSGRPNAYVNWILFDEQFRVVSSGTGFSPVNTAADVLKVHSVGVDISKNGYLYVYCSNESNQDVFFDNLQVIHTRGPLLEETHYYPFGLTMAGISSKAAGKLENRMKFNGGNELQSKEFSDGSGLETYDAVHRMYDPQLGRFGQIDKLSDLGYEMSPYAFASNDPISRNDPSGLSDTIRTNTPTKTPGFGNTPNDLGNVTVSASNHRYQQTQWFGFSMRTDTHLRENLETFTGRINSGQDIIQNGDRYSYIQTVLNGKLPDWFIREQEARQAEQDFYSIYFSLATLPSDVVGVIGIIKGLRSLPSIAKLIKGMLVNKSATAILKDGYFEVNGLKFSEFYYNKLWTTGRGAPSLIAQEVLGSAPLLLRKSVGPDFIVLLRMAGNLFITQ